MIMLKTPEEKLGYALGVSIGKNLASLSQSFDHPALFKGMTDVLAGKHLLLTEEEMHSHMSSFEQIVSLKEAALGRKKQGELFLAENASQPGVVSLPSGLQYKIIQMGQGTSPKKHNLVTVHYRGFLIDGTEFANTYQSGTPQTFAVNEVIKGWTEALQMMKPGDIWHIFLPPDLAYGKEGYADAIAPDTTLAFQIELLNVSG